MTPHNRRGATLARAAAVWAALAAPACCATAGTAQTGLLYVALNTSGASNSIAVFPRSNSRKSIGTISEGVDNAYSLVTDSAGTLYVGNSTNTVTVYPAGKYKPSRTYTQGISGPAFMAIGPDGSLYVSNSNQTVVQFLPGSMTPSRTISFSQAQTGVAVDNDGDLFVITGSLANNGDIQRFKPGSVTGESLGLHFSGFAADLAIDSKHNYLLDFTQYSVEVLARDAPHQQIASYIVANASTGRFALSAKDQALYVVDLSDFRVVQMAYPYHNYANVIDGVNAQDAIAVTAGGVP